MTPELSVVIPVYNNWWLTARCLRELERLREFGTVAFETIVVDNASTRRNAGCHRRVSVGALPSSREEPRISPAPATRAHAWPKRR